MGKKKKTYLFKADKLINYVCDKKIGIDIIFSNGYSFKQFVVFYINKYELVCMSNEKVYVVYRQAIDRIELDNMAYKDISSSSLSVQKIPELSPEAILDSLLETKKKVIVLTVNSELENAILIAKSMYELTFLIDEKLVIISKNHLMSIHLSD